MSRLSWFENSRWSNPCSIKICIKNRILSVSSHLMKNLTKNSFNCFTIASVVGWSVALFMIANTFIFLQADVPQWIEHMCFPDAYDWTNSSTERLNNVKEVGEDRSYVVTLTSEAGQRKYVYCRRIKPEGESVSLPLCYCILSPHQAHEFYLMVNYGISSIIYFFFLLWYTCLKNPIGIFNIFCSPWVIKQLRLTKVCCFELMLPIN